MQSFTRRLLNRMTAAAVGSYPLRRKGVDAAGIEDSVILTKF